MRILTAIALLTTALLTTKASAATILVDQKSFDYSSLSEVESDSDRNERGYRCITGNGDGFAGTLGCANASHETQLQAIPKVGAPDRTYQSIKADTDASNKAGANGSGARASVATSLSSTDEWGSFIVWHNSLVEATSLKDEPTEVRSSLFGKSSMLVETSTPIRNLEGRDIKLKFATSSSYLNNELESMALNADFRVFKIQDDLEQLLFSAVFIDGHMTITGETRIDWDPGDLIRIDYTTSGRMAGTQASLDQFARQDRAGFVGVVPWWCPSPRRRCSCFSRFLRSDYFGEFDRLTIETSPQESGLFCALTQLIECRRYVSNYRDSPSHRRCGNRSARWFDVHARLKARASHRKVGWT